MRLLYAEDEPELSEALVDYLEYRNFVVDAVTNGDDALDYAMTGKYDGIILDIMMPGRNGLEVLSSLRSKGCTTPIILLTAKAEVEDKVLGLDMGADDYLPKPFHMEELLARLRAAMRRREEYHPDILSFGDMKLDTHSGILSTEKESVSLSRQEYRLMEQLMMNSDGYITTEELFLKAWGFESDADIDNVWLYVSYLRKHISRIKAKVAIVSKRTMGYRLEKSL